MKKIIITSLICFGLLVTGSVVNAATLVKKMGSTEVGQAIGQLFAKISLGKADVEIYKIHDSSNGADCYISVNHKFDHQLSCIK